MALSIRSGHASLLRVHLLASQGHLESIDSKYFDCVSCQLGKQTHLSFTNVVSFPSTPFVSVHYDIWGPAPIPTEWGISLFCCFY